MIDKRDSTYSCHKGCDVYVVCDFHNKDINRSLDEVEKIERGLLLKLSYKRMMARVKQRLNEGDLFKLSRKYRRII